jgi:hypothetical protein
LEIVYIEFITSFDEDSSGNGRTKVPPSSPRDPAALPLMSAEFFFLQALILP